MGGKRDEGKDLPLGGKCVFEKVRKGIYVVA